MEKPKFVYVTYIHTTPQKVWDALMDPETTCRYWSRHKNVSDWKAGSRWEHQDYDNGEIGIAGKVIESREPSRLVLTWADPDEEGDQSKTSKVTFEIEEFMDAVKLTVLHEDLEPDSEMLKGITRGWPAILSSLKTLLETGEPLAMTSQRFCKHD